MLPAASVASICRFTPAKSFPITRSATIRSGKIAVFQLFPPSCVRAICPCCITMYLSGSSGSLIRIPLRLISTDSFTPATISLLTAFQVLSITEATSFAVVVASSHFVRLISTTLEECTDLYRFCKKRSSSVNNSLALDTVTSIDDSS
ncbi:hypothetical protein D3C73_1145570 [compost metagenome]